MPMPMPTAYFQLTWNEIEEIEEFSPQPNYKICKIGNLPVPHFAFRFSLCNAIAQNEIGEISEFLCHDFDDFDDFCDISHFPST